MKKLPYNHAVKLFLFHSSIHVYICSRSLSVRLFFGCLVCSLNVYIKEVYPSLISALPMQLCCSTYNLPCSRMIQPRRWNMMPPTELGPCCQSKHGGWGCRSPCLTFHAQCILGLNVYFACTDWEATGTKSTRFLCERMGSTKIWKFLDCLQLHNICEGNIHILPFVDREYCIDVYKHACIYLKICMGTGVSLAHKVSQVFTRHLCSTKYCMYPLIHSEAWNLGF